MLEGTFNVIIGNVGMGILVREIQLGLLWHQIVLEGRSHDEAQALVLVWAVHFAAELGL